MRPKTKFDGYKNVNHNGKSVGEHRAIAERALGKPLPIGAIVHHVDGNKLNNKNSNLVICPDNSYHRIIHRRQRALEQGGNANYRLCRRCNKWDDPANNMHTFFDGAYHRECEADHAKECRHSGRWAS
jgi:hypothetical protein